MALTYPPMADTQVKDVADDFAAVRDNPALLDALHEVAHATWDLYEVLKLFHPTLNLHIVAANIVNTIYTMRGIFKDEAQFKYFIYFIVDQIFKRPFYECRVAFADTPQSSDVPAATVPYKPFDLEDLLKAVTVPALVGALPSAPAAANYVPPKNLNELIERAKRDTTVRLVDLLNILGAAAEGNPDLPKH